MAAQSKKSRKHGRSKIGCQAYRNSGTREKNKLKRLIAHLRLFPNDECADKAAEACAGAHRWPGMKAQLQLDKPVEQPKASLKDMIQRKPSLKEMLGGKASQVET